MDPASGAVTIRRDGAVLLADLRAWTAAGTSADQFVQWTEGVIPVESLEPRADAALDISQPDPWTVRVRVEPVRKLERPVTLAEIKAEPKLAKMELIRQSRLSVAPVRDEEWRLVLDMAKKA